MHNKVGRVSAYFFLIIALMLQSTVLDNFRILGAKPDLMLLLVVFFALFFGPSAGIEIGFVAGILKDVLSLDVFGANTVILAMAGFVTGLLGPKFSKDSKATQATLVFLVSLISMSAHYIFNSFLPGGLYIRFSEYLSRLIIPSSVYTSLLSVLIFPLLMHKYRLEEREEFL